MIVTVSPEPNIPDRVQAILLQASTFEEQRILKAIERCFDAGGEFTLITPIDDASEHTMTFKFEDVIILGPEDV